MTSLTTNPDKPTILLAGATGKLGGRIAQHLLDKGAQVRIIVRPESNQHETTAFQKQGASVVEVDFRSVSDLVNACSGADCVVSALSGLRDVIVDTQTRLLEAAVKAGVTRFIPSDYCIDYTKLPSGTNRNLDLRMEFRQRLDEATIKATSVFNGMFMDLLLGQAPIILSGIKRVVYWEDADQPLDFTTLEDTAAYTAAVALDASVPRDLHIAGQVASTRMLKEAASRATGNNFRLIRAGSLKRLDMLIRITRLVYPKNDEVFPPWQGMQYMRNMFSGLSLPKVSDNERYSNIRWTSVEELLASNQA